MLVSAWNLGPQRGDLWHMERERELSPVGILVLGLNPGLQHILRLRVLDLGQDRFHMHVTVFKRMIYVVLMGC